MSKILDRLVKEDDRLHEWFRDDDGIWLYCCPGFEFVQMECGTCRENTVAAVLAVYRYGIVKSEEQ